MAKNKTKHVPSPHTSPSGYKRPEASAQPIGKKQPRSVIEPPEYSDLKASWRIGKVQMTDPYGWHLLNGTELLELKKKLATFESNTWKEIFVTNARNNHRIKSSELKCPIARKWMADRMPDQDYLWTLRLSGPGRIWGVLAQNAYQIIFWDPTHAIWETPKK